MVYATRCIDQESFNKHRQLVWPPARHKEIKKINCSVGPLFELERVLGLSSSFPSMLLGFLNLSKLESTYAMSVGL